MNALSSLPPARGSITVVRLCTIVERHWATRHWLCSAQFIHSFIQIKRWCTRSINGFPCPLCIQQMALQGASGQGRAMMAHKQLSHQHAISSVCAELAVAKKTISRLLPWGPKVLPLSFILIPLGLGSSDQAAVNYFVATANGPSNAGG